MTPDHFHLCLYLDERGRPCNRRTMKSLTMCSMHRPKATTSSPGPSAEYQRARRRLAQSGVSPAMEAA